MGAVQAVVTQVLLWGLWGAAENFGVRMVLQCAYAMPIHVLRLRRPEPKSAAAVSHWHAARMLVAVLYLGYCVSRTLLGMQTNYYTVLHTVPWAPEADIKRQFRHFAKVYHPDKAGYEHEDKFLALRQAYSTLSDPVLRFAFGNDVESWERLSSMNEFMRRGIDALGVLHVQLLFAQALAWVMMRGKSRPTGAGTFWGLLLQAVFAYAQLQLVVSNPLPEWLRVFGGLTAYQVITVSAQNFTPFLLTMEQCTTSLGQLTDTGSWSQFQFGDNVEAAYEPTPEDATNAQIASILQEEPHTLADAKRQIDLLAGAVLQLEQKVVADCAPYVQQEGEESAPQASEKEPESAAEPAPEAVESKSE